VFAVDLGSLNPAAFRLLGPDFSTWERDGFPLPEETPARLPIQADIYISGLDLQDIKSLSRLRRFLGTDWPTGKYRELLASQPFLAQVSGYPLRIEAYLKDDPELARYLFYAATDGLRPIIP
jgi:hypothetical protein